MAYFQTMDWHEGERQIQELTKVGLRGNPTSPFLTPRAANLVQQYSLLSLGTLDSQGRPWCTVWGGNPPFVQPVAQSILGVTTTVDVKWDPVVEVIYQGKADGEVMREDPPGRMLSGLTIHLEDRGRIKLYGRMIAGALSGNEGEEKGTGAEAQLVWKIDQSLGNCPKYLNRKKITSHTPNAELLSESIQLSEDAISLVHQADLFFVSSAHEREDMDGNHRGGPPGFIRVKQPTIEGEGSTIIWPEYSGNNLYQTLGNLMATPKAGLCIPDFETGDVLYVTGTTEVLVGADAAKELAKSRLAVKLTVTAARHVRNGLPFRGTLMDDSDKGRSPYNPRVRYLTSEKTSELGKESAQVTAKLIKKTQITPTINRYRFALADPAVFGPWKPGQYVAYDFSDELYTGYSHMRDDDPTSLNDDYIRTFTVSSIPGALGDHGEEFEVTIRNVGKVTQWLNYQREGMVEVAVRGFGGEFSFNQAASRKTGFIAAGIGITPLLGQMGELDVSRLQLLWSVGVKDIGLVADILDKFPRLRDRTVVFLTGEEMLLQKKAEKKALEKVKQLNLKIESRRIRKEDLVAADKDVDDWYLCTAPRMRKDIQDWLPGKSIVYENFDY